MSSSTSDTQYVDPNQMVGSSVGPDVGVDVSAPTINPAVGKLKFLMFSTSMKKRNSSNTKWIARVIALTS